MPHNVFFMERFVLVGHGGRCRERDIMFEQKFAQEVNEDAGIVGGVFHAVLLCFAVGPCFSNGVVGLVVFIFKWFKFGPVNEDAGSGAVAMEPAIVIKIEEPFIIAGARDEALLDEGVGVWFDDGFDF